MISVVIPIYNQEKYLDDCIQSVLNQTVQSFEIVLVNDGSTDSSQQICDGYAAKDQRIKVIHQKNKGLSAARNAGILKAEGSFISLLDSDDMIDPRKFDLQLEELKKDPRIDIIYTAINVIDENGKFLNTIQSNALAPESFLAQEFFRNLVPTPSTVLGKSQCFKKVLFNEEFKVGEDLEWILRTAHQFCFSYLDIPLTKYRRHGVNLSENLIKLRESELKILNQYSPEHIREVVEKTRYSEEEKHLLIGKILYVRGNLEEAAEFFIPLKIPLAQFYLGNCRYLEDNFKEAKSIYEHIENGNPAVFNNLGLCYAHLKQPRKARVCFEKSSTLKEGYWDPIRNMGALETGQEPSAFTRRELRKDLLPYQL